MLWQNMTINNEKTRKRKPPRGILTEIEKEKIKKGNISRQAIYNIRGKTLKAIISDLPLIFENISFYNLCYDFPEPYVLDKLLKVYFDITKIQIMRERSEKGIKIKVSDKLVWKRIIEKVNVPRVKH